MSIPIVKGHVSNVISKLQAANRTEVVILDVRHKLVSGWRSAGHWAIPKAGPLPLQKDAL